MALTQVGFLGKTGPCFIDDSTVSGKKIFLQGTLFSGVMKLQAKQPAFAVNVLGGSLSDYSLGPYSDNQVIGNAPAFKSAPGGNVYDTYKSVASDWVDGTTAGCTDYGTAPTGGGSTTTTGGGSTTTTGGGTTTTGGGGTVSTGGGTTTTGGDVSFSAPTIMEQITSFFSNYWWLVLIVVGILLYKPFIAPALGLGKKKRSYR